MRVILYGISLVLFRPFKSAATLIASSSYSIMIDPFLGPYILFILFISTLLPGPTSVPR